MADKIPVKARYSGSDVISLGELETGDTINASYISNLPSDLPATGADGNVLTSDGTNWASEAPAGGGSGSGAWTVKASGSGTGPLILTSLTGKRLKIFMDKVIAQTTSGSMYFYWAISGTSWDSSTSHHINSRIWQGTTVNHWLPSSYNQARPIQFDFGGTTSDPLSFEIDIDHTSAGNYKVIDTKVAGGKVGSTTNYSDNLLGRSVIQSQSSDAWTAFKVQHQIGLTSYDYVILELN